MEKDLDKKCMKCGTITNNYVFCNNCQYTVCFACDDFIAESAGTITAEKITCPKCGGIEWY